MRGTLVEVAAWGDGAEWAVEHAGELLGFHDDDSTFAPTGLLVALHARFRGVRVGRSRAVYEALLRSVLEQKVPGAEAVRSHRAILRAWGTPAPGPMPPPEALALQPYHAFHPFNVEMKRANTLRRVAQKAARLEATVDLPRADALARLQALDGMGPWTAASVMAVAHGDADAVPVGDYHLPHLVSLAFTGEPRGTDDRMLELLAPFAGHRGRVIRLLQLGGPRVQRKGPRVRLRDFRSF
jgi:3-methyladenine DNA glycosylase/8-oxoguanine DNA glycosylase